MTHITSSSVGSAKWPGSGKSLSTGLTSTIQKRSLLLVFFPSYFVWWYLLLFLLYLDTLMIKPWEICVLVYDYLQKSGYKETSSCFNKECPSLNLSDPPPNIFSCVSKDAFDIFGHRHNLHIFASKLSKRKAFFSKQML